MCSHLPKQWNPSDEQISLGVENHQEAPFVPRLRGIMGGSPGYRRIRPRKQRNQAKIFPRRADHLYQAILW